MNGSPYIDEYVRAFFAYVAGGGLAFAEEIDMEKLSAYARKGWQINLMQIFSQVHKPIV